MLTQPQDFLQGFVEERVVVFDAVIEVDGLFFCGLREEHIALPIFEFGQHLFEFFGFFQSFGLVGARGTNTAWIVRLVNSAIFTPRGFLSFISH